MKAKWIGYLSDKEGSNKEKMSATGACAQYYRTNFALSHTPIKAEMEISGLGIFKAYINGQEVGNEFFAPGWTNFKKRILLRKYDVLSLLQKENGISVCMGEGWYVGFVSILGRKVLGDYPLELYVKLTITYEDGTIEEIVTDENWKAGLGAIRENDFLYGEVFDARLPHLEISKPDFDDSDWACVEVQPDKTQLLHYENYEPVVIKKRLQAELISENENTSLYNFNQNFAGIVRIKAVGDCGDTITIRHGERLDEDGSLFTKNLRYAKANDIIICNGKEFSYMPTMTYHGFQYVEITCTGNAKVLEIEGLALYNDLERTGNFLTSNSLVNKLNSNIEWGMRSNFVVLPTDCPQRSERLGWSGDTQVFSRSAMYIADCRKFYNTHLLRINDDREGGKIPDIIPFFNLQRLDSTGWRDVAIILPYNLWEIYGDTSVIYKNLSLIEDYIKQQQSTAVDYLWEKSYYGDWLNHEQKCDPGVLATLANIYCFECAIKMLKAIDKPFEWVQSFLDNVKEKFTKTFIKEGGEIFQGTQTVYAYAYINRLITKEQAYKHLKENFEKFDNHICAGFLGLRFILPVLCEIGLSDLAYKLLCTTSFPSWGYSIVNGATTIWEHWDSWTIDKGFKDPIMNSFNHYSLGSCAEWFYEYALGIKPLDAGFAHLKIQPYVDKTGNVKHVAGDFNSVRGKISVRWEKQEKEYFCEIVKPSDMKTEFVFENVTKIICDGKETLTFLPFANVVQVYFGG